MVPMSNRQSGIGSLEPSRIGLAAASLMLSVLLLTVAGAWAEARWPNEAGNWITVTPLSQMEATDAAWLLRRVQGVHEVVTVLRTDAQLDAVEPVPWASMDLYAIQSSDAAAEFTAPVPSLQLLRGRPPGSHALDEVVLSYEVAHALRRQVGDTLAVRGCDLEIVGIWAPSARVSGNWVQVSPIAAKSLLRSVSASAQYYLVRPEAGRDSAQVAARIWRSLPGMEVVSPAWERAQARQERFLLCLVLGFAVVLSLLLNVPLLADLCHESSAAPLPVALLSGMTGLAGGWAVLVFANGYARDALGLTPLRLTLRLVAGMAAVILVAVLASRRCPRRWPWALRSGLAAIAVALCGGALVAVGALAESLDSIIVSAQQTAADRVTVQAQASSALLQGVQRLPGVRGYAIEAYAGTVEEEELRWLGPWPASGILYGIQNAGVEGTLSVPYHTRVQGRSLAAGAPDEAVLGFDLAQSQGLEVGDWLLVRGTELRIVGIREHVPSDGVMDANWRVEVSLEALRRVLHDPTVMGELTLLIPPSEDQEDKTLFLQQARTRLGADSLSTLIDRLAEVARAHPSAWTLEATGSEDTVRHAQSLYAALAWVCGLVLLPMGALAVGSAFVHKLRCDERRVGLLKAFGMQDGGLLGGYLEQAIAIGIAGGLLCLCLGWACLSLINALAVRGAVELLLTPRLGAGVLLFVLLACVIAAAIPASSSARRDAMPVLYDMSTVGGLPS